MQQQQQKKRLRSIEQNQFHVTHYKYFQVFCK